MLHKQAGLAIPKVGCLFARSVDSQLCATVMKQYTAGHGLALSLTIMHPPCLQKRLPRVSLLTPRCLLRLLALELA